MRKYADFQTAMDLMLKQGVAKGVLFRTAEDDALDGRLVTLDGQPLVNFGSCSYMGLEMDERLKEGAIEAIRRYGTQFSSSRGYLSAPLYRELETLLQQIFGIPPVVMPTTSLGHVSALPILVQEDDLVLIDQQVHASVQTALNHVKVHGVEVEVIRHNRMDLLEARLRAAGPRRRVWYMADGVYSMFGDLAPLDALEELLGRFDNLHLYLDDAHAMSWCGPSGRGYATDLLARHSRVVVATSLNKAFAAGGGVVLTSDAELRRKILTLGAATTFSGPIQPASLGAAIASATLHVSGALVPLQAELESRIRRFNQLCEAAGLPLYSTAAVPIRFIAVSNPRAVFQLVERLKAEGFYLNASIFPSVPMTQAGLRITLTLHQTAADLERLVTAIAKHLPEVLAAEGSSVAEVRRAFGLAAPEPLAAPPLALTAVVPPPVLQLNHFDSIEAIDSEEWDRMLGANGSFNASGLRFLEQAFSTQERAEDRWKFHYYIVRRADGAPVLATFFTEALWKDDMMASAEVSLEVERRRHKDPTYLTSKTLAMGSLLTEGQHLYLDPDSDWRGALALLLREVERLRQHIGAGVLAIRDIPTEDDALGTELLDRGYARFPMPDSAWMPLGWKSEEAYWEGLSPNSRKHQRKKVLPFEGHYTVDVLDRPLTDAEHDRLYELYLNVKARNLAFNCFELPRSLFRAMESHPDWEFLLLRLKPEHGGDVEGAPVAFIASFRGPGQYVPMVCGLDYRFVGSNGTYRQLLRHVVQHANREGFERLYFGIGATHEKARFGARLRQHHVYIQNANHYHQEILRELMSVTARASRSVDR